MHASLKLKGAISSLGALWRISKAAVSLVASLSPLAFFRYSIAGMLANVSPRTLQHAKTAEYFMAAPVSMPEYPLSPGMSSPAWNLRTYSSKYPLLNKSFALCIKFTNLPPPLIGDQLEQGAHAALFVDRFRLLILCDSQLMSINHCSHRVDPCPIRVLIYLNFLKTITNGFCICHTPG